MENNNLKTSFELGLNGIFFGFNGIDYWG
ncbi:MAG: hypothetical protein RLZZ628_2405, partial [Bacteroidota bacterium]